MKDLRTILREYDQKIPEVAKLRQEEERRRATPTANALECLIKVASPVMEKAAEIAKRHGHDCDVGDIVMRKDNENVVEFTRTLKFHPRGWVPIHYEEDIPAFQCSVFAETAECFLHGVGVFGWMPLDDVTRDLIEDKIYEFFEETLGRQLRKFDNSQPFTRPSH